MILPLNWHYRGLLWMRITVTRIPLRLRHKLILATPYHPESCSHKVYSSWLINTHLYVKETRRGLDAIVCRSPCHCLGRARFAAFPSLTFLNSLAYEIAWWKSITLQMKVLSAPQAYQCLNTGQHTTGLVVAIIITTPCVWMTRRQHKLLLPLKNLRRAYTRS